MPLSVTGNTVIAASFDRNVTTERLVALNCSDGSVLWQQNNMLAAALATFGRLVWGIANVNTKYRQGAAFIAATGQQADGTPSFPTGAFGGMPPW